MMPALIFGGFFLKNLTVPSYLNWISYISWFMYGNEALSINQWHGVTFHNPKCDFQIDHNVTDMIHPGSVSNQTIIDYLLNIFTQFQDTVVCSGDDILDTFNFNPVSRPIYKYTVYTEYFSHNNFYSLLAGFLLSWHLGALWTACWPAYCGILRTT